MPQYKGSKRLGSSMVSYGSSERSRSAHMGPVRPSSPHKKDRRTSDNRVVETIYEDSPRGRAEMTAAIRETERLNKQDTKPNSTPNPKDRNSK